MISNRFGLAPFGGGSVDTERMYNSDFDFWTDDDPDSWDVVNENATDYFTESNGNCRVVYESYTTVMRMTQITKPLSAGVTYNLVFTIANYVKGDVRLYTYGAYLMPAITNMNWKTNGDHTMQFTATSTEPLTVLVYRYNVAGGSDYEISKISLKPA